MLLAISDYKSDLTLIVSLNINLRPIHHLVLLTERAVETIPYRVALIIGGLDLITLKDDLVYQESCVSFCGKLL